MTTAKAVLPMDLSEGASQALKHLGFSFDEPAEGIVELIYTTPPEGWTVEDALSPGEAGGPSRTIFDGGRRMRVFIRQEGGFEGLKVVVEVRTYYRIVTRRPLDLADGLSEVKARVTTGDDESDSVYEATVEFFHQGDSPEQADIDAANAVAVRQCADWLDTEFPDWGDPCKYWPDWEE